MALWKCFKSSDEFKWNVNEFIVFENQLKTNFNKFHLSQTKVKRFKAFSQRTFN